MPFEGLPIRRKVTVVVMLTTLAVLLLTTLGFTIYDLLTFRQELIRGFRTTARLVADHSASALRNRDQAEASHLLESLRADPDILNAALFDSAGKRLAAYAAPGQPGDWRTSPGPASFRIEAGRLVIIEPVSLQGQPQGALYLRARLLPLQRRLGTYAVLASTVLACALIAALLVSRVLQRRITAPVLARADIERRRAEESRAFLAAIIDSSPAAIIGKDPDGKILSWNTGAERMFGYTAAEMLGQPVTRILSPDRPEEERTILQEARQGRMRNYETVRRRKDGTTVELSISVTPVRDAENRTIGIASIAQDITERLKGEREVRESRARLSGIIGSAMDAIISVDAQQRICMFNAAAEKMFGWKAEEVMNKPLDILIPERLRGRHRGEVEEFGRTGVTSRAMGHLRPLSGLRSDGQEFPIEASISQIESGGQKIFTVILRDMTERFQAQEEIRRMNQDLERRVEARTAELTAANQELEAFTYSVAHDLRAPLRHVDAFSKILQEEYAEALPLEARRFLDNIRGGSRHMSRLVDDLLNLARVGRKELQRQPIPLDRLVQDVLDSLKDETRNRNIQWELRPLPTVQGDAGLLKQVFTNLLSNAIKYTRPRSPARIEVGTLTNDSQAVIYVRDNGVGFNMKYADKLFGVFQRLHRADEFEGTGVGLATVERIIHKHGGCVWAEGALDKGAAFYFTVPATPQEKKTPPKENAAGNLSQPDEAR